MTEQNQPVTIPGALRQYLQANLPDLPIYRNETPADTTPPVVVIIDPTDTRSEEMGKDLVLIEQIQVDLYLVANDYSSIPDALHTLLHRAPIGIPGSQIHSTNVIGRRLDQTDPGNDDGIDRIIYTVEVKRRITAGDSNTPLPFPVRPDRLQAHEAKTTNVHGITDTSKLETKTGASTKANAAQAAAEANAKTYTDEAIASFQIPTNVETTDGAQAKADAALTAANSHTDAAVAAIDLTPYATQIQVAEAVSSIDLTGLATHAEVADAVAGIDLTGLATHAEVADAVSSIDLTPYETKTGATSKANTAEQNAKAYTDTAVAAIDLTGLATHTEVADAETAANTYTDTNAVPNSLKGAPSGVATLGIDGLIPSNQLPPLAISDTYVVASQTEMLALTAQVGDIAVRSDLSKSFILQTADPSVIGHWKELLTPPDTILSVDGRTGAVSLTDLYDASGSAAAAQTAANAYTDSKVGSIDFSTLETKTGATTKANTAESNAVATAHAYTDTAVAAIDLTPYETKTGATSKANAAQAAAIADAHTYTDTAVAGVVKTRQVATTTTSVQPSGGVQVGTITLGKAFRLYGITTNVPARVRLYTTGGAMMNDSGRVLGWKPAWNAGVIAEIVTETGVLSSALPGIDGANMDSTPSSDIAIAITNLSGSSAAVTVSLTYIVTEA